MFPGLSSRLEKDIREQYCSVILKGETNHIAKSINVIVGLFESGLRVGASESEAFGVYGSGGVCEVYRE